MNDDQLRQKLDSLLDDYFRPHQDYIYNKHATSDFLDAALALIRQDRRELLTRLKQECHYKLLPREFKLIQPLFDAELQHGAGLEEADDE